MKAAPVFLLVLLAILSACTTTSGNGFDRGVRKDQRAHAKDSSDDSSDDTSNDDSTPGVTIQATPSDAEILFNGAYAGTGSAFLDTSIPGVQTLVTVLAPSYRSQTLSILSSGQTDTEQVDLDPITGYLDLTLADPSLRPGLAVQIDGSLVEFGPQTLLIGDHVVGWKKFGYIPQSTQVTIFENQTSSLNLALAPAEFKLSDLGATRGSAFNPALGGPEGRMKLRFSATAPGHARVTIQSPVGEVVFTQDLSELDWSQTVTWMGTASNGAVLADGAYQVVLTGASAADTDKEWARVRVTIDHTITRYLPTLLWTPSPDVLPPGTLEFSTWAMGHSELVSGNWVTHVPLSMSMGVGLGSDWDFSLRTALRLWSDSSLDALYGDVQVKHKIDTLVEGTRLAFLSGVSFATWLDDAVGFPATDFLADDPAVKLTLAGSWGIGRLRLVLAPELDLSLAPTPQIWMYGRGGIHLDLNRLSLGLSAEARSTSLGQGMALNGPMHFGLEAKWRVSDDDPFYVSALATVEAFGSADYAVYGGFALGTTLDTLDIASQITD